MPRFRRLAVQVLRRLSLAGPTALLLIEIRTCPALIVPQVDRKPLFDPTALAIRLTGIMLTMQGLSSKAEGRIS